MVKKISIIAPAFNEEDCVDELATRLAKVFDQNPNYDFEAILVENGSSDRTFELLSEIHEKDSRFTVLTLAKNFQTDGGISAGLSIADGDAAVLMTADLQDPPEPRGGDRPPAVEQTLSPVPGQAQVRVALRNRRGPAQPSPSEGRKGSCIQNRRGHL